MASLRNDNERTEPAKNVILAGIDLSPISQGVLDTVTRVGGNLMSELHIVHVLKMPADEPVSTFKLASLTEKVKGQLWDLANTVPSSIARIVIHLRLGDPALEIAQLASDLDANLIVVGTHSPKGLTRLLLGSVAESLVRNAPCAVLTYRPKHQDSVWVEIAAPCPDCKEVQDATERKQLWCARHSEHHPRAHTYNEVPSSYGIGSQTFR